MSRRPDRLLLIDIVEAIERIESYVSGFSREEFRLDSKTVDAVVRNIGIIGEAASRLSVTTKALAPETAWPNHRNAAPNCSRILRG